MLVAAIGYLGTNPATPAVVALVIAAGLGIWLTAQRLMSWRARRAE